MLLINSIKKYKKQLAELYKEQELLEEKYDRLIECAKCITCNNYNHGAVQRYVERFSGCNNCNKFDLIEQTCKELESVEERIDVFIEHVYAKAVFNVYSKKKKQLVRVATNEECSWEAAFDTKFEKLSKNSRHSLVGLIEGWGKYRFK